MSRSVVVGAVYRHFKGNKYRVICIAKDSETLQELIIYKALYGEGDIYARPVKMFLECVDRVKYPDAEQNFRFELIDLED